MIRLAVIAILALAISPAATASPKSVLYHSAAMTRAVDTSTICVPHWQAYLRQRGETDTPWLFFLSFGSDSSEVASYAMSDRDCDTVLRSHLYEDADVAISLYYAAEMAASDDTDRAIAKTFYRLRRAFHIRRSVTISDFF